MDKANYMGSSSSSCSSSSFTVDLFGPKGSSSKSSTSSTGFFGSIFGPSASTVPGRDPHPPDYANGYGNVKHEISTDYKTEKGIPVKKDKSSSNYENGKSVEPCYYNSSIYYGGQEVYSPTTGDSPPRTFKKDVGNVDQNESNSTCASRGNWWQGSLYY